ncbi:MAG TPA: SPOR domain-containing protein [Blastocatellia bacterium]|nr:SPOR domain-containing protein [Blastocatellia bacterium]
MADLRPGSEYTMNPDNKPSVCPLCKRPLDMSGERSDPTRLCDECRLIVQSILPASQPPVAAKQAPQPVAAYRNAAAKPENRLTNDSFDWPDPLDTNPLNAERSARRQDEDLLSPHPIGAVPPVGRRLAAEPTGGNVQAPVEARAAITNSDTEWPVYLGVDQPKSSSRVVKLLLAVLIFAGAVAVGYYAYGTYIEPRLSQTPGDATGSGPTARVPESPATERTQPSVGQASSTGEPRNPASQPTSSSADLEGGGNLTLQAASSPSEAAARELSEKLIRAGIPAYVVAADLGPRGRWFRVRVGRFNDRNEAAKFGEQSRLRARAAGISLQVIVVDYEKPQ